MKLPTLSPPITRSKSLKWKTLDKFIFKSEVTAGCDDLCMQTCGDSACCCEPSSEEACRACYSEI